MRFGAPEFIKWLLLIIPLILLFIWMHRQRNRRLASLISSKVWKNVIPGRSAKRSRARTSLRLLVIFCVLLALTRPQWGSHWEEVKQRGLDIIVVLDTSKSMLAEDIKPNRLQQAQWAVRDFVKQIKGDRIGLIAFAGSSFLQCPVTVDYAAFTMMLNDLYAGIIPRGGTAIEQALQTAVDSFDKESAADRVIILITDGEDHEGDPLKITERLRKDDIKLFSIGVGTLEGELVPTDKGYVKDSQGRVVKSSLNETLLEKLARETGGFYVRSAPGDFGLDRIYKMGISSLQRGEQETRLAKVYEEQFGWFAAAALFFLLAEGVIRPRSIALFLILFCLPNAQAAEWVKAYRGGDYSNAFQTLEQTVEKFPDIGNYNRGNVLYRQKDFQGSEKAYSSAAAQTTDDQLKQKALYNRGTALLASCTGNLQVAPEQQIDAKIAAATQAAGLFEQALALNPDDLDAKQNLERAINLKKQLEQQRQEQEKQQKQEQKQEQEQKKDSKDKQDEKKKDQSDKSDQKEQQEQEQQQQQNQEQDQKKGQQQQQSQPQQQAGEMSEEEAQQLLDAMKQDEQDQRANLRPYLGQPVRVNKDW